MREAKLRDALRRIQDIIARETGAPLRGEAAKRLEGVLGSAIAHPSDSPHGERFLAREVTILLADLRGFTAISSSYPAGTVLDLLNRCLVRMSEITLRHHGAIDKFMGDSILVIFDAAAGREDHVQRALACAVDMQLSMQEMNNSHRQQGMPELYLGIGINTGTVMAGLLGSELYSEYTVIGDNVNLASRIEAFSLRGQVLISPSTFDRCQQYVQTGEPMDVHVKGKASPVSLREVLAIPSLGQEVPRQEVRRSPRVQVKIPFSYQIIENNIVIPERHRAMILDVGYHGVLAEFHRELAPFTEIKLDADLPLVGYQATDMYAKVVKTKQNEDTWWSGVEFTSISAQCNTQLQLFVQLLIQGSENR